MECLYELLEKCCPTVDFRKEEQLVTGKIIDSLDLVAIVSSIEDEFGVEIDVSEIDTANFDSVEKIWNLIQNLKHE